jgi:hypothetical protein
LSAPSISSSLPFSSLLFFLSEPLLTNSLFHREAAEEARHAFDLQRILLAQQEAKERARVAQAKYTKLAAPSSGKIRKRRRIRPQPYARYVDDEAEELDGELSEDEIQRRDAEDFASPSSHSSSSSSSSIVPR